MRNSLWNQGVRFGVCLVMLMMAASVEAQHRLVTQGDGRLVIVNVEGAIEWEMPWGGIHDIHQLPSGNLMVQRGAHQVVEIDVDEKRVVWSYDSQLSNGNEGRAIEVHSFQPLADGSIMIAESGVGRVIEINRDGELLKELKLTIDHPHPHTDTRLVRKLANGNYLVCHEADGCVREYEAETGEVVWDYVVPMFGNEPKPGHGPEAFGNKVFAALRLPNGNTLIATGNGHSVIEVTPDREICWELHQHELPDITLAWVTTLEVLPSGNLVFGNCHAGPGNPLLIEIEPKSKQVVWTYNGFDQLGNSVSNSLILSSDGESLR